MTKLIKVQIYRSIVITPLAYIHSHTQQHTKNILDIVHQKTDLPSRQKLQEKVKENEQHVLFPI